MIYALLPVLVLLVLPFGVQLYLDYVFGKWSRVENNRGMNGVDVAETVTREAGLRVTWEQTSQPRGDHYDSSKHVVRLSPDVAGQRSVVAMAVAAHELGHAQQHEQRIQMIRYREILVPAVRLAPTVSYALILIGTTTRFYSLLWVGAAVFGLSLIFMLLTLPIEFDASRRGMRLLEQAKLLGHSLDARGVRQVLIAAGLTYVAASALSVTQLVRYLRYLRF